MLKLEDIASKLQGKTVRETNESESKVHMKQNDQVENSEKFVKCDTCGKGFKYIYDLETHMKIEHESYPTYKCDVCGKNFITKWRLKKHSRMHLKKNLKLCCYYRKKEKHCPFDDLGCKFLHEPNIQIINLQEKDTFDNLSEFNIETFKNFCTSTPKKQEIIGHPPKMQQLICENSHEILDPSQCDECLVIQYIRNKNKSNITG